MSEERMVDTPHGPARLVTKRGKRPYVTLLLSHGAGSGIDTPDLLALEKYLPRHGITVARLEQPWKVAGRPVASSPKSLDESLIAVANWMRVRNSLVLGGRSAGARSAVRCARALGANGALALSFPLHPPGRPDKSRIDELRGARVPTLVVQGERDPMGRPEEFPADLRGVDLCVVPGGDHSLAVPKQGPITDKDAMGIVVESVLEWIVREAAGNQPRS